MLFKVIDCPQGPPVKEVVAHHISSMRFKFKAWMREGEWGLWLLMVDHSSDTRPKHSPMGLMFEFMETRFGNCLNTQGPSGPN